MTTLLLLLLVVKGICYSIDYYDCNNVDKIHRYQIDDLCNDKDPIDTTPTDYSIVQLVTNKELQGYSCQVIRSMWTFYCGAYSHYKLMAVPDIEVTQNLSKMECQQLISTKIFKTPDGKSHQISLQATIVIKSEDLGLIKDGDDKVSCEGEEYRIGRNIINNVLKVSQYKVTLKREKYMMDQKGRMEVSTDHMRLPRSCRFSQMGCQTSMKTYIWMPPESKCNYQQLRRTKMKSTGDYLIDDKNKILLKVLGKTPAPSKCPTSTLILTEYPDIFLTTNENFPKFGEEIEIDTFITSLADYTLFSAERAIQQATSVAQSRICQQRYTMNDEEIHSLGEGHYGSRNGDVIYLFSCEKKIGRIDPKKQCYEDIPIQNGFVSPISRLLLTQSAPVRCNKHFPMEIKTNEGWITLNPSLKKVQPPLQMPFDHYRMNHKDLVGGGIYTQYELTSWRQHLDDRNFQDALVGTLSYGVCVNTGNCEELSTSTSTNFDLTRLNPLIILDELNIWEKFDKFLKDYSTYLAVIVILIETTKFISMIVVYVTTLLQQGMSGFVSIVFLTCCGSVQRYRELKRKAAKRKRGTMMAMDDIDDINDDVHLKINDT